MAGRPLSGRDRDWLERLESRTLLSGGPFMNPHVLFQPAAGAGVLGYERVQVRHAYGEQVSLGPSHSDWARQTDSIFLEHYDADISSDGARRTLPLLNSASSHMFHDVTRDSGSWLYSPSPGYEGATGLGAAQAQALITRVVYFGSAQSIWVVTVTIPGNPEEGRPAIVRDGEPDSSQVILPPTQTFPQSLPPTPQPVASGPQTPEGSSSSASGTIPASVAPAISRTIRTAAGASTLSPGAFAPVAAAHVSLETAAVARAAASIGAAVSPMAEKTFQSVGTFAIVAPTAAASVGQVSVIGPGGAATGAVRIATGWVQSAAATVARAFESPTLDAPAPAGYFAPVAYNLLRLNPAALFNDRIAAIIGESASLSPMATSPHHNRAWAITGAVVAADAMLVGFWHFDRRRKLRAARKRQTARPFSVGPAI